MALQKAVKDFKADQTKGAYINMAEELFADYYKHRKQVYQMNFFRGIFFGLGSVLGGTVVVALIIWILSVFIHIPIIGDYVQNAQQSVEQKQR